MVILEWKETGELFILPTPRGGKVKIDPLIETNDKKKFIFQRWSSFCEWICKSCTWR